MSALRIVGVFFYVLGGFCLLALPGAVKRMPEKLRNGPPPPRIGYMIGTGLPAIVCLGAGALLYHKSKPKDERA